MLTNRKRGDNAERRLVNKYRKMGWYAIRSSGSIGHADVLVINPITKEIKLIQRKLLKDRYLAPKERQIYEDFFKTMEGIYTLKGEILITKSYKRRNAI